MNARELHDQLLKAKPEGARHDADICSFCVEKASQAAPVPPGPEATNTAPEHTEGGTTTAMSDNDKNMMSVETHEALMEKALREATSATDEALEAKIAEVDSLKGELASLKESNEKLTKEAERLNDELDKAALGLKEAKDKAAALETEKAEREEAARIAEIASQRTEQVRTLGLFEEEYITEKASAWAKLPDTDWAERVEEWTARKPGSQDGDQASALSGTSAALTNEGDIASQTTTSSTARRSVLGL